MNVLSRRVALLSLTFAACASLPAVPTQGGPRWYRLESEHFVLHSDLSKESARDRILLFERLLDAYYQLGWEAQGKLPVKLHIVVFSDSSDFEVFAGGDIAGFHVAAQFFEPLVVMPDAGRIERWQTLKHELTHYIAFQSLPRQPPWFAEGLAVYFQTAYFDTQDRFVIGDVPEDLFSAVRGVRRVPVGELFSAESWQSNAAFYGSAWLLVHYLMSQRGEAFAKYQDQLVDAQTADAAWATAFPDLPASVLDQEISRYFATGEFAYFTRPVRPYAGAEPRVTELGDADVHALRAQLYLNCPACGADERRLAAENVEQALRLEPNHLRASVIRNASLPPEQRLGVARELVRAHPEAWLAWVMLASAELSVGRCAPEVSAHLRELGVSSARALMFAAVCQAASAERKAALELSARALRRQPADTAMLALQAGIFQAVGECAELQRLLPRLREAVHPRLAPETLEALSKCRADAFSSTPTAP